MFVDTGGGWKNGKLSYQANNICLGGGRVVIMLKGRLEMFKEKKKKKKERKEKGKEEELD